GPSVKIQAMLYLDATLAVLQREGIPLATPVHGKPARGARFIEIPVHLDRRRVGPMAMRKVFNTGTLSAIQAAARIDGLNVWQIRDALVYQYQLDQQQWKFYKRTDLPSSEGIGLGVGREIIPFELYDKNTLVAGETRSGKSVTIETILFALMDTYTQAEMGLVIIDPNQTMGIRKDGLRTIEVGSFTNAAHLLRPVAYNHDQIEAAINYVYQQWRQRMSNGIQDAPAIVLVIDELMSEAVVGDKESGSHNEAHLAKLSQLASQGIKNNIFLVVGAQDPKVGNTSSLLMRNLGLRFIGHVTDQNASRVLAGRSGVNAHLLTGKGDFVQVSEDSQRRFQVAEPTLGDFDQLARRPVKAEAVGQVDIVDIPDPPPETIELNPSLLFPEDDKVIWVDAQTLALYFHKKKLSVRQAKESYGIIRRAHETHIAFAHDFQTELLSLRAGSQPNSPYYLGLKETL
ncbi:MAG: hypothetical protein GY934_19385, partial [Gammaproteobacteria bacterium]|nr:hypothetical protein [Gammaproteobacteria bacterium]